MFIIAWDFDLATIAFRKRSGRDNSLDVEGEMDLGFFLARSGFQQVPEEGNRLLTYV